MQCNIMHVFISETDYKIFAHHDGFIWISHNMTICLCPVRTPKLSGFSGVWTMHGAGIMPDSSLAIHHVVTRWSRTIESFWVILSYSLQAPKNKFVIASLNCSGVRERSWDLSGGFRISNWAHQNQLPNMVCQPFLGTPIDGNIGRPVLESPHGIFFILPCSCHCSLSEWWHSQSRFEVWLRNLFNQWRQFMTVTVVKPRAFSLFAALHVADSWGK